jgi:single-strand DNA-binding protein
MNTLKNNVQLVGNLGMNPEVKNLENGKKVAKVSMATHESYRNAKGEKITETQWHNLVAWGKTASIIEKYLKKGSEITVTGKLVHRNYIDSDNVKRNLTEIKVSELLIAGSKK